METKNILITDDDQQIRNVLNKMIQLEGYNVFLASNGEEAVEAVRNNTIHVAFLDIEMPVMNGIEALKGIKKIDKNTEILIVTGHAGLESLRETIDDLGAFDYIVKPFHRTDILNSVRNALVKHDSSIKEEPDDRIARFEKDFEERTRQLRESQVKYREIVESSNDIILVVQDGKLKFANTKIVELTGFTQEEILGTPFVEIVFPEDRKIVEETYLGQLERKDFSTMLSFRMSKKLGEPFWVEGNSKRTIWEDRPAVLAFIRDINERKQAEEALHEQAQILSSIQDTILVITPEMKTIYANQTARDLFGDRPEMFTEPCYRFFKKRDTVCEKCPVIESIKDEKPHKTITKAYDKNGQEIWRYNMAFPFYDQEGRLIAAIEIVTDYTAQKMAEIALLESEKKYRTIFENSRDAIYINRDGKYTDINQSMLDLFGYTREEMIGMKAEDTYACPDERGKGVKEMKKKGSLRDYEIKFKKNDGQKMDCLVTASAIKADEGKTVGYQGIIRDITEQKRIKIALERERQQFLSMFDGMDEVVYVADPDTYEVLYMNGSAKKHWGDGIGQKCHQVLQNLDSPCSFCTNGRIFVDNTGTPYIWEFQNTVNHRWYRCIDKAIHWPDGRIVRFEMAIDFTERKLAKEKLNETTELLQSIMNSATEEIIAATDPTGLILSWNEGARRLLGYEPEEVVGKESIRIFHTKEFLESGRMESAINNMREKGKTFQVELTYVAKNGKTFPVQQTVTPRFGKDGEFIGMLGMVIDITERKQAQEELTQSNEQLEQAIAQANQMAIEAEVANMAKSEFLANMSHEIRTPMNGVLGFADMLLDTNLDEDQTDYARTIKRSGDSLLSLINDILDLSKIEAEKLDFKEIDFDPELLAYDVCEMIRPKIESKPIEVLCRIGDNVPSMVKGDPTRYRQVLTNLMGNAPKFTESGEIELSLDIEEEKDDRIKLHAKIRDTGIGIPKDKLSTIFEPFQQADGSTTRKYGGTGLGLSLCKKISEVMGGDVWAERSLDCRFSIDDCLLKDNLKDKKNSQSSIVNRQSKQPLNQMPGSVFHFTAWLGKAEEKKSRTHTPVDLSNKKVLIVDDNRNNLEILTHFLESVEMGVVGLTSGEEVVPALQKALEDGKPFDLCISDIRMPDMDGYEVAKQIRNFQSSIVNRQSSIRSIPLLALSSTMERDAKKCEEAGFNGFLSKPIRKEKLYKMLEKLIEKEAESKEQRTDSEVKQIATQYSVKEEMKHSVRVLLVEDNPVNQKLAKMMLTKAGYQVEVANNGKEAVDKYTQSPGKFDLVIMDIQMPEMDGLEATKEIRKFETENPQLNHSTTQPLNHLPIIALTANAMQGDREMCLEAGMDDYMTKPIKRELVFDMIKKWVLES